MHRLGILLLVGAVSSTVVPKVVSAARRSSVRTGSETLPAEVRTRRAAGKVHSEAAPGQWAEGRDGGRLAVVGSWRWPSALIETSPFLTFSGDGGY